ncbi:MAG: hypothetical protein IIB94_00710 [Candidatus Marinimicrobia bacterium]|nr:hypothetical protein [Candidatus Neomarinimicrobiota bacterium]
MKLIKYISVFILAIALSGCGETVTETIFDTDPPPAGTIDEMTFSAALIGEATRTANVYLPPGYNAARATGYPVVYQLHGVGGDEDSWPTGFDLAQLLDRMIDKGALEPTIVVMPSASNALGGGFYTNSFDHDLTRNPTFNPALGFGAYEALIISVLMPTAEATYNIDVTKRGIMGHSMGGYGAMKLALLYPTMFVSVASHSGPLAFNELINAPDSRILKRIAAEKIAADSTSPVINFAAAAANRASNPVTLTIFALASSFSPHYGIYTTFDNLNLLTGDDLNPFDNYQYPIKLLSDMGTPDSVKDDLWIGVDLPIVFDSEGAASVQQDIFDIWLYQDVYTMLDNESSAYYPGFSATQVAEFSALNIYFDTGLNDDFDPADDIVGFGIIVQHEKFADLLTSKGITHVSATYTGAHSDGVYTRIDEAYAAFNTAIGN